MLRHVNKVNVVVLATMSIWMIHELRSHGQTSRIPLVVAPQTLDGLRQWDATVDRMQRDGDLRVRRLHDDTLMRGRTHERLAQFHRGVRVWGADMTRQLENGQTISIFGMIYSDIDLDPILVLDEGAAQAAIEKLADAPFGRDQKVELVIFPTTSAFVLAYTAEVWTSGGPVVYFVDARTGQEVWRYG